MYISTHYRSPCSFTSIINHYQQKHRPHTLPQNGPPNSRNSNINTNPPFHIHNDVPARPCIVSTNNTYSKLSSTSSPSAKACPSIPCLEHMPSTATSSSQIRYQLVTLLGPRVRWIVAMQLRSSVACVWCQSFVLIIRSKWRVGVWRYQNEMEAVGYERGLQFGSS